MVGGAGSAGGAGVGIGGGMVGGSGGSMAACACEVPAGPAVMTFVGGGSGDFIQETNYKYVGFGAGEFAAVTPKRTNYMCFVIGGVVLVVAIVVAVLLLMPTP